MKRNHNVVFDWQRSAVAGDDVSRVAVWRRTQREAAVWRVVDTWRKVLDHVHRLRMRQIGVDVNNEATFDPELEEMI